MAMDEDEEAEPTLSASTMAALQSFYTDRDARAEQFEALKAQAERDFDDQPVSMAAFSEDWNASQFWYSDETATALAKVLLEECTSENSIAVVSAPSVFVQLKNLLANVELERRPRIALLEFDERFAVFREFVRYDYTQPLRLPEGFKGAFDRIIVDPPFLSDDCQTKAALTVRTLAKSWDKTTQRLIVCTGERMEELILRLYGKAGVQTTPFVVQHTKGLSNEFRCYANVDSLMSS